MKNLKKRRKRKRIKTKRMEKDGNKEEKEENKEEKEEDEKEKEKDEKQQEKEAKVSVAVDANTANQPVDGDDIDEEPNEDLANLVRSITKSILKDTVVQEKQPNVIKKATKKPIESKLLTKESKYCIKVNTNQLKVDSVWFFETTSAVFISSDGDKKPVAEETIVLKNIHQEIASKIYINVDCGEKYV
ncbi:FK506-binding protein 5-like [Chenopodium quinoa]|uniref:FK506-binding protein 5-like n=1 Tax=Chenopodium quinoa TaxID=63459 RepID=UPI000B77B2CB|nr:FK506-binding protein 5-like [Chenopodium quinoa]